MAGPNAVLHLLPVPQYCAGGAAAGKPLITLTSPRQAPDIRLLRRRGSDTVLTRPSNRGYFLRVVALGYVVVTWTLRRTSSRSSAA